MVDPDHGDVRKAYAEIGSPRYPTTAQIQQLQKAAILAAPETIRVTNGTFTVTIPSFGLAVVQLK